MMSQTSHKQNIGLYIVALLASLQGVLRLFFSFGGAGLFCEEMRVAIMSMIDNPVSDEMLVIVLPFFLLGLTGIVAAVGLLMRRPWGAYGTVAVSFATIAYDVWAAVAIQPSAVMGMVIPVIAIVYILARRDQLFHPKGAAA